MLKCGDKFCFNPEIKNTEECLMALKDDCFYRRDGQGCEECGGRVIRQNGCYVCIECGYSPCG